MDDRAEKRRGARRGMLAGGGVSLALAVAYWGWGLYQESMLNAQVEQSRRAGAPVLLDEFNRPTGLADPDNAVVELRAAARAIGDNPPGWKAIDNLWPYLPFDEDERRDLRAALARYAPVLAHVDAAVLRPGVDWHIRYTSPPIDMVFPDLSEQRELARLLAAAALEAHDRGDDGAAVARVRQILFVGRAVGRQYVNVAHLVSVGLTSYGAAVADELVPELRVEGSVPPGGNPVTRAELRALIADLLDEDECRAAGARAMVGRRAFDLETLLSYASRPPASPDNPSPGPAARLAWRMCKPMVYPSARRLWAHESSFVAAIARPDWDAAHAAMSPPPESGSTPFTWVAGAFGTGLDRELKWHFVNMAARRTTAVALAVRWYAADHGGRFPESPADLVPAYLPAVPADPMDHGRTIRYLPDHDAGPVVYSAGDNAIDDGGSEAVPRPEYRGDPFRMADFVLHLTRQPRPPKPPPDSDGMVLY